MHESRGKPFYIIQNSSTHISTQFSKTNLIWKVNSFWCSETFLHVALIWFSALSFGKTLTVLWHISMYVFLSLLYPICLDHRISTVARTTEISSVGKQIVDKAFDQHYLLWVNMMQRQNSYHLQITSKNVERICNMQPFVKLSNCVLTDAPKSFQ